MKEELAALSFLCEISVTFSCIFLAWTSASSVCLLCLLYFNTLDEAQPELGARGFGAAQRGTRTAADSPPAQNVITFVYTKDLPVRSFQKHSPDVLAIESIILYYVYIYTRILCTHTHSAHTCTFTCNMYIYIYLLYAQSNVYIHADTCTSLRKSMVWGIRGKGVPYNTHRSMHVSFVS